MRLLLPGALTLAALLGVADGPKPTASASPGRPAACWLLDSPQAVQVSGGGLAFLRRLCRGAPPRQSALTGGLVARDGDEATDVRVNDPSADVPPVVTQNETTIKACGGTVLAAWNDFAQPGALTGYGRSTDGGATWTDAGAVPGMTGSDPVLAAYRDCRFYFAALTLIEGCSAIGVARSDDGGVTWGPAANASAGTPCGNFQDKGWIAVDNTGGPYDGTVYACWDDRAPTRIRVLFSSSQDGGDTFSEPVEISRFASGFATGCQIDFGPGGQVYVVWSQGNSLSLAMRVSQDGGQTFSPISSISTTVRIGAFQFCGTSEIRPVLNGSIRTFNWPSFAANPRTGALHVAWNDGRNGDPDILYSYSEDGGANWSEPLRLNDDETATDQFQPALSLDDAANLRVIWYDRRLDPEGNLLIDVYSALSTDGGRTFQPNERITDVSFGVPPLNPSSDPAAFACYMGDYIGIDGDGVTHYMAWRDNRNAVDGQPDPDIFFDKRSSPPPLLGDADCDEDVDATDALFVLRYVASLPPFGGCTGAADVDCNGAVNVLDALGILRHAAGLPPALQPEPCPEIGTPV